MITAQPSVIIAIVGCGLLALAVGMLWGYTLCRTTTDRKLRYWLTNYGKPQAPKPRAGWRYYI